MLWGQLRHGVSALAAWCGGSGGMVSAVEAWCGGSGGMVWKQERTFGSHNMSKFWFHKKEYALLS
jgi:hypothetical protein